VLLNAIKEIGLDIEKAKAILNLDMYADDISFDVDEARNFGITGVPFFVIT